MRGRSQLTLSLTWGLEQGAALRPVEQEAQGMRREGRQRGPRVDTVEDTRLVNASAEITDFCQEPTDRKMDDEADTL
ncbi:hypothetical protein NDU88_007453 [Pleurodeles waltl]|uniref:Uncharacterized protein n=1 Tax=Pleurodeles waltl TaxID=8319 RepID=A0AAV7SSJ8_PLEWA|nr:hypothetical protein NDU88_007453 [Pleurodeles waltl]